MEGGELVEEQREAAARTSLSISRHGLSNIREGESGLSVRNYVMDVRNFKTTY